MQRAIALLVIWGKRAIGFGKNKSFRPFCYLEERAIVLEKNKGSRSFCYLGERGDRTWEK
jgi:hypothetical protein